MALIDIDIAGILQDYGVGTIGVNLFAGLDQPSSPSGVIFVVNTGTYQPNITNLDYSYPSCQVTIRSEKGERASCDDRTKEVVDILHGLTNYSINYNRYIQIFQNSGPISLLEDGTMRPKNIVNFNSMRTTIT